MQKTVVNVREIPAEGQSFVVEDQSVWLNPIAEFGMDIRIAEDMIFRADVLPSDDGLLLRGSIKGTCVMPCSRCAEDTVISVDASFDEFEEFPGENSEADGESLSDFVLRNENGIQILDLGALAWEEFALALPTNPLCRPDCKGVCPVCGKNRNSGSCSCADEGGHPGFAALRGMKI